MGCGRHLRLESVIEPICRFGAVGSALAAGVVIAGICVAITAVTHALLAGSELRPVDLSISLLIPLLLGTPILLLLFRAVQRLELARRELQHLSMYDGTTGAWNRRFLVEVAARLCERARAAGEPMSVVLMDADLFKQVNDRYGHPAGDAVLRRLVRIIHACIEPPEIYGRYGGEEFAIFLPGVDESRARARAEQIRHAIAVGEVLHRGRTIKTTVSMGVACCAGADATVARLTGLADVALYAAKRAGRNRTEIMHADGAH